MENLSSYGRKQVTVGNTQKIILQCSVRTVAQDAGSNTWQEQEGNRKGTY
eukprot:m.343921 g.343921  ORF g.343921 m.343921 type:complete len:50 (-) comp20638_c0_seq2:1467-1616(-)